MKKCTKDATLTADSLGPRVNTRLKASSPVRPCGFTCGSICFSQCKCALRLFSEHKKSGGLEQTSLSPTVLSPSLESNLLPCQQVPRAWLQFRSRTAQAVHSSKSLLSASTAPHPALGSSERAGLRGARSSASSARPLHPRTQPDPDPHCGTVACLKMHVSLSLSQKKKKKKKKNEIEK